MIAISSARRLLPGLCLVVVLAGVFAMPAAGQRGGGGAGGGGTAPGSGAASLTRLDILEAAFKLNKDQKKTVRTILDEAHKSAAPLRESLGGARTVMATAIQGSRSPQEIDAAATEYGRQAAAMATLEMTTLARLMQTLDPEQRANASGVRSAFFLMRGIFLDNKKWDEVPDARSY